MSTNDRVKLFISEVVGSFLLAHLFGAAAIVNGGRIQYLNAPVENLRDLLQLSGDLDSGIQAIIVGIGLFLMYLILSSLFERLVHLNPVVTIAHAIGRFDKSEDLGEVTTDVGLAWFAQFVGSFAGATLVYVLTVADSFNSITYQMRSAGGVISAAAFWRSMVADAFLGTIILFVSAYAILRVCKDNKLAWSLIISGFYFFYMSVFWSISRLTVDFLRSGAYCLVSRFEEDLACASYGFDTQGSAFLWHFLTQIGLLLVAYVVGYLVVSRSQ